MGKVEIVLVLFSFFVAGNCHDANGNAILMPRDNNNININIEEKPIVPLEQWFQNLNQAKQKLIKIHFYIQDFLGGENATTWKVAKSKITTTSPSFFGTTCVGDNKLTSGPEPQSPEIGRIQGLFVFADLEEFGVHMSVNIVFTQGKYKGSTLSVSGRNPMFAHERELPIVGGTGVFRMARGMGFGKIHTPLDESMTYQVLESNLYVITYE